jgi:ATP/maltotriose-dependent transcriptional regulator MalT
MATTTASGTDPLAAGRAALDRADWDEARTLFERATAAGGSGAAWEGLSRAAWWQGDQEVTLTARERAFREYRAEGDARGAARMAMWLASDHLDFRGDDAVAEAWLRRGRSMLDGHGPCPEEGWIALLESDVALLARGDPATAERGAHAALALAREIDDAGVEVVGLAMLGSALIASGRADEGLARLDDCVALAVAEEFDETAAPGWALCHTVSACANVGDFDRAAQWCRTMHAWCATWRARHFFGICRTAYGEVLATSGDWESAEEELASAIEDLGTTRPALAAPSSVRLGRLRMRQGVTAEARKLFDEALPLPQAVLSIGELDLEGGDHDAALDAAERVLRNLGEGSALDRFPAVELRARAHAAAGRRQEAADAAAEAEREAASFATPYMRGRALLLRAEVLAAAEDCEGARTAAEDALDCFTACSAPYEAARARLQLARALEALGRGERAEAEARTARKALALLGVREPERERGEGLTAREAEILGLVAAGLGDAEIAARLFLSPHTVHRHVANIRTKMGAPSRAAAVAEATRQGML